MTITNNTSILPELKPKIVDINESLRLSKILISKNWTLPSKTIKRSSNVTNQRVRKNSVSTSSDERKQVQNRDAQRAYRERKANKIKEMEDTIESLQKLVIHWKNKYNLKEKELNDLLRAQNDRTNNQISSDVDMQVISHNHGSLPLSNTKEVTTTAEVETETPSKCGFCNEGSSCVCAELEHTDDNNINTQEQTKASITSLVTPLSKKKEPSIFNCSGSSATCEKCSNIEETCIKPAPSTILNTTLPESNEIDFTHLSNNDNNNNNNNTLPSIIQLNNGTTFQRIRRRMK